DDGTGFRLDYRILPEHFAPKAVRKSTGVSRMLCQISRTIRVWAKPLREPNIVNIQCRGRRSPWSTGSAATPSRYCTSGINGPTRLISIWTTTERLTHDHPHRPPHGETEARGPSGTRYL